MRIEKLTGSYQYEKTITFHAVCRAVFWLERIRGADGGRALPNRTLHGTMVYASISKNVSNGVEWSLSGQETYDGKGHMKYHELLSYGLTSSVYDGAGTYTISADCVATVTYIDPDGSVDSVWKYFVSANGEHYYWNNNLNQGVLSAGRADRVSRALLIP